MATNKDSSLANNGRANPQEWPEDKVPNPRKLLPILLEHSFNTLVMLNEAYQYLYPDIPPRANAPCIHNPNWKLAYGPGHSPEMVRQGERLSFVGMLLRTAEHIRSKQASQDFPNNLKDEHPAIAHGVAVFNFLIENGICPNQSINSYQTLINLQGLVRALRESNEKCKHACSPFPGTLNDFFDQKRSNCGLILIITELVENHCKTCYSKNEIAKYVKRSANCLKPSHWHGCRDCESMLLDILVYTKMLNNTPKRMMASLRLNLRCAIDSRQNQAPCQEDIKKLTKLLFMKGFTEVKHHEAPALGSTYLEQHSLDYEAIYISGWQHDKKDGLRKLLDRFLEKQQSRLFFIQLRYQFKGHDTNPHCCEPQIMEHLQKVICTLYKRGRHLTQFIKMHLMLEQDPCSECRSAIMPAILSHLCDYVIAPQLVTMMEHKKHRKTKSKQPPSVSPFLQRLTNGSDPVLRLRKPPQFGNRHTCTVCGGCKYIRCHFTTPHNILCLCVRHYYKPSLPLTVNMYKLRYHTLHIRREILYIDLERKSEIERDHPLMYFDGVSSPAEN